MTTVTRRACASHARTARPQDWQQVKDEGATVYSLHEIRRDGVKETFDDMLEKLKDYDKVYISFDIDVFDMSYAPVSVPPLAPA